jgi:hypothetical protein
MPTSDLLAQLGLTRNPFVDRTAECTRHASDLSLYVPSDLRAFSPSENGDATFLFFGRRGSGKTTLRLMMQSSYGLANERAASAYYEQQQRASSAAAAPGLDGHAVLPPPSTTTTTGRHFLVDLCGPAHLSECLAAFGEAASADPAARRRAKKAAMAAARRRRAAVRRGARVGFGRGGRDPRSGSPSRRDCREDRRRYADEEGGGGGGGLWSDDDEDEFGDDEGDGAGSGGRGGGSLWAADAAAAGAGPDAGRGSGWDNLFCSEWSSADVADCVLSYSAQELLRQLAPALLLLPSPQQQALAVGTGAPGAPGAAGAVAAPASSAATVTATFTVGPAGRGNKQQQQQRVASPPPAATTTTTPELAAARQMLSALCADPRAARSALVLTHLYGCGSGCDADALAALRAALLPACCPLGGGGGGAQLPSSSSRPASPSSFLWPPPAQHRKPTSGPMALAAAGLAATLVAAGAGACAASPAARGAAADAADAAAGALRAAARAAAAGAASAAAVVSGGSSSSAAPPSSSSSSGRNNTTAAQQHHRNHLSSSAPSSSSSLVPRAIAEHPCLALAAAGAAALGAASLWRAARRRASLSRAAALQRTARVVRPMPLHHHHRRSGGGLDGDAADAPQAAVTTACPTATLAALLDALFPFDGPPPAAAASSSSSSSCLARLFASVLPSSASATTPAATATPSSCPRTPAAVLSAAGLAAPGDARGKLEALKRLLVGSLGFESVAIFVDAVDECPLLSPDTHPRALRAFARACCRNNELLSAGRLHLFFPATRRELGLETSRAKRAARFDRHFVRDLRWSRQQLEELAERRFLAALEGGTGAGAACPPRASLADLFRGVEKDEWNAQLARLSTPREVLVAMGCLLARAEAKGGLVVLGAGGGAMAGGDEVGSPPRPPSSLAAVAAASAPPPLTAQDVEAAVSRALEAAV